MEIFILGRIDLLSQSFDNMHGESFKENQSTSEVNCCCTLKRS